MLAPAGGISLAWPSTSPKAHQHAQAIIDKQQQSQRQSSRSSTVVWHTSHHRSTARLNNYYGTKIAGGKRWSDRYQPWPARCAAAGVISFCTPRKVRHSKTDSWYFRVRGHRLIVPRLSSHSWINPVLRAFHSMFLLIIWINKCTICSFWAVAILFLTHIF